MSSTRIRAAVVDGPGRPPEITEVDLVDLRPEEVLVRIGATGICHTDVAWATGELYPQFPVVLGHESAGVVEAIGAEVTRVRPGDRVVLALTHHCGSCASCESGHPMLCETRLESRPRIFRDSQPVVQGFGTGGFAEAAVVKEVTTVRVPDGVPVEVAAVAGCALSTGLGAVINIARVEPGSSCLVLGCGGIGLNVVMGCRVSGAGRIVAVDPSTERRALAAELGATETALPEPEALRELAPKGFDFVFECVGRTEAMEMAMPLSRIGGTTVLIGAPKPGLRFSLEALEFVGTQRRLLGCLTGDVRPDIDLERWFGLYLDGRLPLDRLITGRIPLDEIGAGFDRAGRGEGIRTLVVPDGPIA